MIFKHQLSAKINNRLYYSAVFKHIIIVILNYSHILLK